MLVILMAAVSIARASLYSGAEEVGFYCQVFIPFHDSKGRVRVPKWMNFWKGSKRLLTPTPRPSEWSLSLEIMHFLLSGPRTSFHIFDQIHYKKIAT